MLCLDFSSGSSAHKKQEVKQQADTADILKPDKKAKKPVREEEGKLYPGMLSGCCNALTSSIDIPDQVTVQSSTSVIRHHHS